MESVRTIVIGAGQAGLAMSRCLTERSEPRVVFYAPGPPFLRTRRSTFPNRVGDDAHVLANYIAETGGRKAA